MWHEWGGKTKVFQYATFFFLFTSIICTTYVDMLYDTYVLCIIMAYLLHINITIIMIILMSMLHCFYYVMLNGIFFCLVSMLPLLVSWLNAQWNFFGFICHVMWKALWYIEVDHTLKKITYTGSSTTG